jgi:hypothetical protein
MRKIAPGALFPSESMILKQVSSDSVVRNTGGAEANRTYDRANGANSSHARTKVSARQSRMSRSGRLRPLAAVLNVTVLLFCADRWATPSDRHDAQNAQIVS